jgi:Ca2+-binding RTX toxin-like protein
VIRQIHFIAVVGTFLIGCAVLVVAGCAGVRSEAPQKEEQGHTEATESEEARCSQTRTIKIKTEQGPAHVTTNDVPRCPYGGLLSGTDKGDFLNGKEGEDEIHGLDGYDFIHGGEGNDVIYGGPGWGDLYGDDGEDVLYGGDGNDTLDGTLGGRQQDKLYCGEGRDSYLADENDYVDSSCEKKTKPPEPGSIMY